MTHPHQPGQQPHGQQPDPDPQAGAPQAGAPQGGYPQSGGFPHQGGNYPQPGGYPQQSPGPYPGGYPQHGQYPQQRQFQQYGYPQGGGYGPPPPNKKTGLWIGLSAAAVAVVTFLVTAFLAPGFLLSDDKAGGDAGSGTGTGPASGGAESVAQQLVDGFNNHSTAILQDIACANAHESVEEVTGEVGMVDKATLENVQENGNTAKAFILATVEGEDFDVTAELAKEGTQWCWQAMTESRRAGTEFDDGRRDIDEYNADTEAAETVFTDFVDAINSSDKATAMSFACEYAVPSVEEEVDAAIDQSANLTVGSIQEDNTAGMTNYTAMIDGTLNGNIIAEESDPEGMCIGLVILI